MKSLELKIPPVVVFLIAIVAVYFTSLVDPTVNFLGGVKNALAWLIFSLGVLSGVIGVVTFKRAGTTVHPHNIDRASELVTHGIYRFTRNPMYLGLALIILSFIIRTHSPLGIIFMLGFIAYINKFQILPEERMLSQLFGDAFETYKQQTRRWI